MDEEESRDDKQDDKAVVVEEEVELPIAQAQYVSKTGQSLKY